MNILFAMSMEQGAAIRKRTYFLCHSQDRDTSEGIRRLLQRFYFEEGTGQKSGAKELLDELLHEQVIPMTVAYLQSQGSM